MWKVAVILGVCCSALLVFGASVPCPQEILKECPDAPMDIAFVVDASASIWHPNFTAGLWFMQKFVDQFDIRPDHVRVSMVTYADVVYSRDAFDFNDHTNQKDLDKAIERVPYRGGDRTETGLAIDWMLDHQLPHARPGVKTVVIVLTDGNSQEPEKTKAAADRAQALGLDVFAIGVGIAVSERELYTIASSENNVFPVDSYSVLVEILDRLHYQACGGIPTVPPPEPIRECTSAPNDISFVIDSSSSIGADSFQDGLQFIVDFLEPFHIGPKAVRVAAVMFGYGVYADSAFTFNDYTNKKDLESAIMGMSWRKGQRTDTGDGIDYMVDDFVPLERPDAAHIGIVITDGGSQNARKTAEASIRARKEGINVFAVGVGKNGGLQGLNMTELEVIGGSPSHVLTVSDYSQLFTIEKELLKITCDDIDGRNH